MKVTVGVLVDVKVAVGVKDGVTVAVGVNEGVDVADGVRDCVNVGVKVMIVHIGMESTESNGLIVLPYSSYNFTNFTLGICFNVSNNGSKRL